MALTDAALLSTILFASNQFKAKVCGQKERLSAVNHLQETIRILNERFQDPSQDISDSTIAAVAGLAMTEVRDCPHGWIRNSLTYCFLKQSSGNQANWRIHMKGTKRLVEIRGGLSAFEGNPILHDKLCRSVILHLFSIYVFDPKVLLEPISMVLFIASRSLIFGWRAQPCSRQSLEASATASSLYRLDFRHSTTITGLTQIFLAFSPKFIPSPGTLITSTRQSRHSLS